MRKRVVAKPKQCVDRSEDGKELSTEVHVTYSNALSLSNGNVSRPKNGNKVAQSQGFCKSLFKALQIVILIILIPPFLNYAALQKESTELRPSGGELYDIGWGQKIFKMCKGKGPPTVVFDAPLGMTSDVWSHIWPAVAKNSRICLYDRAGLGFSDRPFENSTSADGSEEKSNYRNKWTPFTVERMADDLHRLLTQSSQEPQPFLLVGAEVGALVAQFYAQMFDNQVMGMILINPLSDDLFEQGGGSWLQYWYGQLIPSFQSLQLSAALGITRLALLLGLLSHPMSSVGMPEDVENRQKYLLCHPKHISSVVDEHHFMNVSFSQLKTMRLMKSLPHNISVTVISGNYYDEQMPSVLNKAWAKSEQNLISRHYPGANHIVINSADRHMLIKNYDAIIEHINKICRQYRNKLKSKRNLSK